MSRSFSLKKLDPYFFFTLSKIVDQGSFLPIELPYIMYQSNRSFNNPPPPGAYPWHLTSFLARKGGNLITTHRVASLDVMLQDKSWGSRRRRQALMNSKEDCVFLADWLKTKGLHKLCSVFEGV